MMRFITLFVMLATGSLFALSAADDRESAATQPKAEEQRNPPVKQSPRKQAKPAATFRPSERIGADSAVSFPVDI